MNTKSITDQDIQKRARQLARELEKHYRDSVATHPDDVGCRDAIFEEWMISRLAAIELAVISLTEKIGVDMENACGRITITGTEPH